VRRDNEKLKITVEDNGIGRKAAAGRKHTGLKEYLKEYSSKGMALTEDRIDIMNKLYKGATSIEISDKLNDNNSAEGTCVVITLPFFLEQDLYS
jgi:hypothetical protein